MQAFIGIVVAIGLFALLGQTVVGWLLANLIVSLLLACFFGKLALISGAGRRYRIFSAICAILWLLQGVLAQVAISPLHALYLFLLSFAGSSPMLMTLPARFRRWEPTVSLSCAILVCIPFGILCWDDCRWTPQLLAASDWAAYNTNENLQIAAPVMVVRTDLEREAWLERVVGVGRWPRISEVHGKLRGNPSVFSAESPAQARSVVLLAYGYNRVGEYLKTGDSIGSGGGAYRNRCSVFLLDLKTRQRRAIGTAFGPDPPHRSGTGFEYGAPPDDADVISAILKPIPSL